MTEQASPHRRLAPGRLVLASHNRGKLAEMAELLAPYGIEMVAASDLGLPEPEETGDSFRANAELKARAAAQGSGLPALADDSGLEVAALDGAPGIHSARWAGPDKNFAAVFDRLQAAVVERGDESARFFCALALAWPDGHCEHFEGTIEGKLVFPPRGTHGFGYDPIFVPEGDVRCFAEMSAEEKHRLSHRARAMARLVDACLSPPK